MPLGRLTQITLSWLSLYSVGFPLTVILNFMFESLFLKHNNNDYLTLIITLTSSLALNPNLTLTFWGQAGRSASGDSADGAKGRPT